VGNSELHLRGIRLRIEEPYSHEFQWNTELSFDVSIAWMKRDQIKVEGQCLRQSRVACGRFICSFKRITQEMPKRFFIAPSKRIASKRISTSV